MPCDYKVIDNGNVIIELWIGPISHAELLNHERMQLGDVSIQTGAVAFADAREAVFPETTPENVHELADLHSNPDNAIRIARMALLVSNETWPAAKKLEAEGNRNNLTIITFASYQTACLWVGVDPTNVNHVLDELRSTSPIFADFENTMPSPNNCDA